MARLLTCGFELKDTTAEGIAVLTATTFSTTSPNGGAVCINCVSATSAASCCQFNTFTGALSTDYWARFYINISANVANAVRVWVVNGSGGVLIFIRLNANGTLDLLNSASATIGSSSAALTPGTWTRVEVYFNVATATTGKCELRVNGSTVTGTNVTNANLGTTAPTTLFLGWNVAAISTATVSFDDFALNNGTAGAGGTTWPGDGKIVALRPVSDLTVGAGWTNDQAATIGLFASVNKSPPTGIADTTTGGGGHQIRNATSNANTFYNANLTTYTAAGLISTDTITCIQEVVATGAAASTSPKTGYFSENTNPGVTGTEGTITFYQGSAVAGTYPTGWLIQRGSVRDSTNVSNTWPTSASYGTVPVMTLNQNTSSTRVAMCCLMAQIVEYRPASSAPAMITGASASSSVVDALVMAASIIPAAMASISADTNAVATPTAAVFTGAMASVSADGGLISALTSVVTNAPNVNLMNNSNFEHDTVGAAPAGWSTTDATNQLHVGAVITVDNTQSPPNGTKCLKIVTDGLFASEGAGQIVYPPANGGLTFQSGWWMKGAVGGEVVAMNWGSGFGNHIQGYTLTTTWTFYSFPWNLSGNPVYNNIAFHLLCNTVAAITFYVDQVMVNIGASLNTYFDGDSPGCSWNGTVGNSASAQANPSMASVSADSGQVSIPATLAAAMASVSADNGQTTARSLIAAAMASVSADSGQATARSLITAAMASVSADALLVTAQALIQAAMASASADSGVVTIPSVAVNVTGAMVGASADALLVTAQTYAALTMASVSTDNLAILAPPNVIAAMVSFSADSGATKAATLLVGAVSSVSVDAGLVTVSTFVTGTLASVSADSGVVVASLVPFVTGALSSVSADLALVTAALSVSMNSASTSLDGGAVSAAASMSGGSASVSVDAALITALALASCAMASASADSLITTAQSLVTAAMASNSADVCLVQSGTPLINGAVLSFSADSLLVTVATFIAGAVVSISVDALLITAPTGVIGAMVSLSSDSLVVSVASVPQLAMAMASISADTMLVTARALIIGTVSSVSADTGQTTAPTLVVGSVASVSADSLTIIASSVPFLFIGMSSVSADACQPTAPSVAGGSVASVSSDSLVLAVIGVQFITLAMASVSTDSGQTTAPSLATGAMASVSADVMQATAPSQVRGSMASIGADQCSLTASSNVTGSVSSVSFDTGAVTARTYLGAGSSSTSVDNCLVTARTTCTLGPMISVSFDNCRLTVPHAGDFSTSSSVSFDTLTIYAHRHYPSTYPPSGQSTYPSGTFTYHNSGDATYSDSGDVDDTYSGAPPATYRGFNDY